MSKSTLSNAFILVLTAMLGVLMTLMAFNQVTAKSVDSSWQLIYSHDESGNAIEGSKQALIEAIRAGKPIRIYWAGRRVEHLTDTFFLTILGGEVFAQIESIQGQAPSVEPPAIEFRENQWRAIFSTNGDRALKWFAPS